MKVKNMFNTAIFKKALPLLLLVLSLHAWAFLPEPPEPKELAKLSFQERMLQGQKIREELLKATPAERQAFRLKLRA